MRRGVTVFFPSPAERRLYPNIGFLHFTFPEQSISARKTACSLSLTTGTGRNYHSLRAWGIIYYTY